jgi:diaminopimelate decarboxylase
VGARAAVAPERLTALAARFGTPLWVLDAGCIRERARSLLALEGIDRVRYAAKANDLLGVLALLRAEGVAVDTVSAGEIRRALRAGFEPQEIRYTSELFERESLALARENAVALCLGSADMLEAVGRAELAGELWLRVNPGFGHGHDERVDTGGPRSKHGIWHEDLPEVARRARALGLAIAGLHVHVGSGSDLENLTRAAPRVVELSGLFAESLRAISAGGGLPVPPPGQPELELALYARAWREAKAAVAEQLGREIALEVEPGRFLLASAGLLLCEVRGRKRTPGHDWVLVDAGFNELLRPSLYGARHPIEALVEPGRELAPRLVAGPLCESGDVFTRSREGRLEPVLLPELAPGELVCIRDVGAYGSTMSSNYNARPLAPIALVDGDEERLLRRRQDFDEMIAAEEQP